MERGYRRLVVWQKAKDLALSIYQVTAHFPPAERIGLVSQLRRAAVSVVSNIAEGQGRATAGENVQFLGHARGSLLEVDTQLLLASELGYIDKTDYERLDREVYAVVGLLVALANSLRLRHAKA